MSIESILIGIIGDLTIFETKDVLYEFNGGWLYNAAVNDTLRRQIDRDILSLRISGKVRDRYASDCVFHGSVILTGRLFARMIGCRFENA